MSNLRTLASEFAVGITVASVFGLAAHGYNIDTEVTRLTVQQAEDQRINAVVYGLQDEVTKSKTLLEVIVKNQDKMLQDLHQNRQLYLRRPEYAQQDE